MPQIDRHPPGAFCWLELATSDQAAAKKFYGAVFGWSIQDNPMGPDFVYTIFQVEGRDVAAGYTIMPEQAASGMPPNWMVYVAVESADDTASRAAALGGKLLMGPFDVQEHGRMAVIQDPSGATFSIWQPRKNTGIGLAGVDSTFCWAELSVANREPAIAFYSALFGWKFDAGKGDPSDYLHIVNGTAAIGGVAPAAHRDPHTPPHWMSYIMVASCDATLAAALANGAKALLPAMTMEGVGRFAIIADPQGAVIALFQPKL